MRRTEEMRAIAAALAALLLALAMASAALPAAAQGTNWVGALGAWLASTLRRAFGWTAWLLVVELALVTWRVLQRRQALLGRATAATTLVFLLLGAAALHLMASPLAERDAALPGGLFGEVLGEVLRALVGTAGALLITGGVLLLALMLRTAFSPLAALQRLGRLAQAWRLRAGAWWQQWQARRQAAQVLRATQAADGLGLPEVHDTVDESSAASLHGAATLQELATPHDEPVQAPATLHDEPVQAPAIAEPAIVQPAIVQPEPPERASRLRRAFALPSTRLLDPPRGEGPKVSEAALRRNAELLLQKLAAYGVQGRVDEIHPGPVVTMYEFEPESGTKIAKIASLADDLALALAAQKVRIVAPIPGKARVGFELPNAERQTVNLREILEDPRTGGQEGMLPMALGKDIAGRPVACDLSKMPHLLVAGATGAGKSVGLNVMLVSLLLRRTPEQVRMLMIDPKVVELAVFDDIPHLLLPVVTDMKKAALALRWAVDEMERRYQLFAAAGARSILSFNERVARLQAGTLSPAAFWLQAEEADQSSRPRPEDLRPLPAIVVVVDEFADLMMVAAKEVETAVARLAQKARAAGIHVILATQRPSVDVITGMIKANFPARIGFKVAQREDSKTILGRSGAEHLLGAGDMLMIPPGASDLKRIHCAFISEDEVRRVCDYLRQQGRPTYDTSILKPREEDDATGHDGGETGGSEDGLYDRAVGIVADAGYCSISQLQRHLGIGYNKAAKLVERMEKQQVVSPPSGKAGGRREVRVSPSL